MGRARPARPGQDARSSIPAATSWTRSATSVAPAAQWDALPADFPHHKLVYRYFQAWTADGTLTRMRNSLREQVRHRVEGRHRQPTAALVDRRPGPAAGKRVNGRCLELTKACA